ncbi:nucleotidyltransferase family protein, partial [Anaerotruncus massiliensis (ex Liu et al. 2021)]|uniref:tRNA(Met) cytidine acetate ligase n=1 Tax=Anaerotruncus massiliensis (ex Liu et al. 2021) TaxID=2321404 RepID=UPI003AB1DE62
PAAGQKEGNRMGNQVVAGIVAEYNPFHNGHAHLIEAARAAGATHIVAVMSGSFVQRGGPACAPKTVRANAAVACGADLVLELPLPYAMATAERFAAGAVGILGGLGCVDVLAFGSECGDIDLLAKAAGAVLAPYCGEYTKNLLDTGVTYARARQKAVEELYGPEVAEVLSSPNNTLAVEYLKQISLQELRIAPFTIPRAGAAHDAREPGEQFASASHLRNLLDLESAEALAPYVPAAAMSVYRSAAAAGLMPFDPHSLNTAVLSTLRRMEKSAFSALPDVSGEGLDNRLYDGVRAAVSLDELLSLVKTKRYPLSRIRRLVWNAYLGVDADLMTLPPPYARVLSFNKRGMEILSAANRTTRIPVSHSLLKLAEKNEACARFASLEARATDLYSLGLPAVQPCGSDYTQKITVR